jgi:hypothetical protein
VAVGWLEQPVSEAAEDAEAARLSAGMADPHTSTHRWGGRWPVLVLACDGAMPLPG